MSADIEPNVGNDLLRIHRVITRALAVSLQNSQGGGPAEEHRPGYATYVRALTILLHAHHLSEDEVAFPFWRIRLPAGPFDTLSEQHRQVIVYLDQLESWLGAGPAAWQAEALSGLARALADLQTLWHTHIDLEEATLGPEIARQYLTPDENAQLGKQLSEHGQAHSQPGELVMPFVVYNMDSADRAEFAKQLPPVVVQQLIPFAWKAAWAPMTPFLLVE